jgi:hypothetical protein
MNRHLPALALAAGLALPGFGQSVGSYNFSPPYDVSLNLSSGATFNYPDVVNVAGLPIARLLTTSYDKLPTPLQKVPGKTAFAFMREWDGDLALEGLLLRGPASTATTASISLNAPPAPLPAPPAQAEQLGNVNFVEWELYAENGVVIAESSEFIYSTKQVVSTAAPPVAQPQ